MALIDLLSPLQYFGVFQHTFDIVSCLFVSLITFFIIIFIGYNFNMVILPLLQENFNQAVILPMLYLIFLEFNL